MMRIIVGSVLAYKINQQNHWLQNQIERSIEGQTVGINDQNIELYNDCMTHLLNFASSYAVYVPLD